jgi:D-alanyl-D-alanine carboxypeptidase
VAGTALGIAVVAGLVFSVAGRTASDGGVAAFSGPLGPCRVDDTLTPHRDPDDWARTLLDTEFRLAVDDVPPDLVPIDDPRIAGEGSLRAFVLDDLGTMAADAASAGAPFRITSAYRSHAHQVRTFESLAAAYGHDEALRSAARPGHSEHQLGTTIDVEGGEAWLADEAWRYGFVVSYPFEHSPDTTCYKAEPWHLRYVGRDAAAEVRGSGVSLRAWLWSRQVGD